MDAKIPYGAAKLSDYPAEKIIIGCTKCGWEKQYDKKQMLEAGGDRAMTHLHDEIRRRQGCTRMYDRASLYDACPAKFLNNTGNAYAKAKGG